VTTKLASRINAGGSAKGLKITAIIPGTSRSLPSRR